LNNKVFPTLNLTKLRLMGFLVQAAKGECLFHLAYSLAGTEKYAVWSQVMCAMFFLQNILTNCPWTTLPLIGLCISNSMKSQTHGRKKGGKGGRREGGKERIGE